MFQFRNDYNNWFNLNKLWLHVMKIPGRWCSQNTIIKCLSETELNTHTQHCASIYISQSHQICNISVTPQAKSNSLGHKENSMDSFIVQTSALGLQLKLTKYIQGFYKFFIVLWVLWCTNNKLVFPDSCLRKICLELPIPTNINQPTGLFCSSAKRRNHLTPLAVHRNPEGKYVKRKRIE